MVHIFLGKLLILLFTIRSQLSIVGSLRSPLGAQSLAHGVFVLALCPMPYNGPRTTDRFVTS